MRLRAVNNRPYMVYRNAAHNNRDGKPVPYKVWCDIKRTPFAARENWAMPSSRRKKPMRIAAKSMFSYSDSASKPPLHPP